MLTQAAWQDKGCYFEEYGGGFIIAHYQENGVARYCGVGLNWSRQPIVPVRDVFSSKEDAVAALNAAGELSK